MSKILMMMSASAVLATTVYADCPVLDLNTLPNAACSTERAPYKTGPLSKMSYVSHTPCPSGVGLRKKLQGIFNGPKSYPGQEVSRRSGIVSCIYNLNQDWQKLLGVKNQHLVLQAEIATPNQANYLTFLRCPVLSQTAAELINHNESIEIYSTRNSNVSYVFKAMQLEPAGTISRFKNYVTRGNNQNLQELGSQLQVKRPFQQRCEYNHKTGGSPLTLILDGTQDVK
ncbi:hypothetical protein [Candidatus Paracaedibacter symbiosus]|uniref:hypothetical protein n=1 Tax=Candidatus Paracaedibacter symbiosus TaxID=244582 RepID=UPI000509A515|nr:hypothetical protein [Candidatus Paracaedibacter symbiosus]